MELDADRLVLRPIAGGGFGPYFMVRKIDGEQVELVVYEATQYEAT